MPTSYGVQVVLQFPDSVNGLGICRGFIGLPFTSAHYLQISMKNSASSLTANQLGEDLARQLLELGPSIREVKVPCRGSGQGGCHALDEPDCLKYFIPVFDGANTSGFSIPAWASPGFGVTVPVVLTTIQQAALPHSIWGVNQVRFKKGNKSALLDILQSTRLLPDRRRIFISYNRKDATALANQLHIELVREGFEVFLDRFSVEPGVDFQRRIDEELSRMGTVLLIESPNSSTSKWVTHEINFARRHRLGLFAINIDGAKHTGGVWRRNRIQIEDAQRTTKKTLKREILKNTIHQITLAHAFAEDVRLNYLTGAVSKALASAGLNRQSFSQSQIIVAKNGNGDEFAIRISNLPPDLADFHALDAYKGALTGYVVAPSIHMDTRRQAPVIWLGQQTNVELKDESEIAIFARGLM